VVRDYGYDTLHAMCQHVVTKWNGSHTKLSIELEHLVPDEWLRKIVPLADVVFLSKDCAQHFGWTNMEQAVEGFRRDIAAEKTLVICPWGEKASCLHLNNNIYISRLQGVAARGPDTPLVSLPGHQPSSGAVVDTLAAGDCFIAGAIHFLNQGYPLAQAMARATYVAGESVGQRGLEGLKLDF